MTLHIITNSSRISRCFQHISEGDSILFAGDGVLSTLAHQTAKTYALESDLEARSITSPKGIERIDTADMVDLVVQHERTITWN